MDCSRPGFPVHLKWNNCNNMCFWVWICPGSKWEKSLEQNYLCFPYLFIFNTLKPTFYWQEEEPWEIINTSSLYSCVKIIFFNCLVIHSHINQWSTSSLSSFSSFLYPSSSLSLPFIFLISHCSLTLLLDDSRFTLVTAPPLCPSFFPPEILPRCNPVCPSVPLSGCSSTQRCLSGWPGAGPRCWTFCLKLWSERPCCCSLCLVSHE